MKVAIIAPPYPIEETPSAPLGLCYVAAAFERAGSEVKIFDYIVRKYTKEKLYNELSEFGADIIGITSVTLNYTTATSILKTAKVMFPSAVTIMGGPHVSFDFEQTLKRFPEIDLVVIGEGERTIAELMPVIENRHAWSGINGLAYMNGNEIVVTPPRAFIQDLDNLPLPSRHLLPMSRYLALGFPISIITSRGCPNKCIFCQGQRMVGNRVRSRDPKQVVDEMESLLSYGFSRINISDDFFTSNIKRVKQICGEITKRGLVFGWGAFARADSVTPELLEIMRQAGCDTIFFGIESGNQQILDRVKKRVKLDRIRKAVIDAKNAGLTVFGSFIAGLPGETWETLMDSHRFSQEIDIIYGYHFLAPFPGTEVMERLEEYGLKLLTDDWSKFDANQPIVLNADITPDKVEEFVDTHFLHSSRLEDIEKEKRYRAGTLSNSERLVYIGNKKLEIVFKLFSEDIIENLGPLPVTDSATSKEFQISKVIAARIDKPIEFILPSLEFLLQNNYLKCEILNKHANLHWE